MTIARTGRAKGLTRQHVRSGNCSANVYNCRACGTETVCDVCHKHDEPRGECSVCPPCPGCTALEPAALS